MAAKQVPFEDLLTVPGWRMVVPSLGHFLTNSQSEPRDESTVPSLFVVRQRLTETLTADSISAAVMRRENYLCGDATVASCIQTTSTRANSDRIHVVALVVSSMLGTVLRNLGGAKEIEKHFFSDMADQTLPSVICKLPTVFVPDDYVRMYRAMWDLLQLSGSTEPAFDRQPQTNETVDGVVVTGAPRVGKWPFLWFLLHELWKTHSVIFDIQDLFVLLRPDGTMIEGDRDRSFRCYTDNTIYLINTKRHKPPVGWNEIAAKAIVVTAARCPEPLEFETKWPMMKVLYMPMWSLGDLTERRRRY